MTHKIDRLRTFILPMLKCVCCNAHDLSLITDSEIRCNSCAKSYPVYQGTPIMLENTAEGMHFSSDVVIGNPYTAQWRDVIDRAAPGPVLDFGSGNNPDEIDNVVKLDVFAMPHVDVVGTGERLPFRDGTFAAVVSGAVFEHVQQPFVCAENIYKAMRPGAELYVETAFLQPYHAYPHHYFNMTTRGVTKVFEAFEPRVVGVLPWQGPLFTLHWIVRRWSEILAPGDREAFLGTTVGEIIREAQKNPFSDRWLNGFTPRDLEELACAVHFNGHKPAA